MPQSVVNHHETQYKFKGLRQNSVCIWLDDRSKRAQVLFPTFSLLLWARPLTSVDKVPHFGSDICPACLIGLLLWSKGMM